jgi:hypothetical protein
MSSVASSTSSLASTHSDSSSTSGCTTPAPTTALFSSTTTSARNFSSGRYPLAHLEKRRKTLSQTSCLVQSSRQRRVICTTQSQQSFIVFYVSYCPSFSVLSHSKRATYGLQNRIYYLYRYFHRRGLPNWAFWDEHISFCLSPSFDASAAV